MGRKKTNFKPYKPPLEVKHPPSELVAAAKAYTAPKEEPHVPKPKEEVYTTRQEPVDLSTLAPPPAKATGMYGFRQEWDHLIRSEAGASAGHESDPNDQEGTDDALKIYATPYKRPLKGEIWWGHYVDEDGNPCQPVWVQKGLQVPKNAKIDGNHRKDV